MSAATVLPGATIGVVGGGQLGRMLALEARRMGYRVLVLDPAADAPAVQVADDWIQAPLDDRPAALELARRADVVTLEWENADVETLREMESLTPVRPGAHVLEVAQHRVREKDAARRLGLGTAEYRPVRTADELRSALSELRVPAVLKTARWGYDGRGQRVIRDAAECDEAFAELANEEPDLILEQWVPFQLEISVLCARTAAGDVAAFPVGENIHRNGILDLTLVPARAPAAALEAARMAGLRLVEGLDVVGLLAVELFVTSDGQVLVNEIAPRPHNSGHYTWEACGVSQFEQQIRAVCGLPLGAPELLRPAAMANLLGEDIGTGWGLASTFDALAIPLVSLHLYGKQESRVGRKMGHLTALGSTAEEALDRVVRAKEALSAGRETGRHFSS